MQKHQKYEEYLMDVIGFDEADLEANRAGVLSRRQMKRLNTDRVLLILACLIVASIGVGLLTIWVLLVAMARFPADKANIVLLIGIGVESWLGLHYGLRLNRLKADLRENRVADAEGRIDLLLSNGNKSVYYAIWVAGVCFSTKQRAFLAFKNGDPYRIYYTPHTKQILSVEWLRDEDNLI